MSSASTFWMGVLLLAVGSYGGYTFWKISKENTSRSTAAVATEQGIGQAVADDSYPAKNNPKPEELNELALTMQTGELFQFQSLKGKVWVGSVFYSLCTHKCKLQNQAIAALRKQLTDLDLTWISLTCDPVMDTPAVLNEYSKWFDADPRTWKFLTGNENTLRKVAMDHLKIPFERQEHSERLVLVDREGNVAGVYPVFDPRAIARFKQKVQELTAEPPAAKSEEPVADEPKSSTESKTPEQEAERAGA
jgi:protein SCO1/2